MVRQRGAGLGVENLDICVVAGEGDKRFVRRIGDILDWIGRWEAELLARNRIGRRLFVRFIGRLFARRQFGRRHLAIQFLRHHHLVLRAAINHDARRADGGHAEELRGPKRGQVRKDLDENFGIAGGNVVVLDLRGAYKDRLLAGELRLIEVLQIRFGLGDLIRPGVHEDGVRAIVGSDARHADDARLPCAARPETLIALALLSCRRTDRRAAAEAAKIAELIGVLVLDFHVRAGRRECP